MGTDHDVPPGPTGTVYGRGGVPVGAQNVGAQKVGAEKPDLFSRLHPAITATVAASLIAVLTLGYLAWRSTVTTASPVAAGSAPTEEASPPAVESPSPNPSPSVSPTGLALTAGTWSLESADSAGRFLRRRNGLGFVETIDADDAGDASLIVTGGLADRSCFSFRTADGRYLRHYAFRLRFDAPDDSELFRKDATFCRETGETRDTGAGGDTGETGAGGDSVRLRSANYRDRFVHRRGRELWLDKPDGTEGFAAASSFTVRTPLTTR
ncbi:MAG TPA: AbfB domain-containing protein [Actinoplanes sp.]|jgi:hypothetical protein